MLFILLLLIATAATANLHWIDATRFDLDSVVNTIIAKIEPLQRKECQEDDCQLALTSSPLDQNSTAVVLHNSTHLAETTHKYRCYVKNMTMYTVTNERCPVGLFEAPEQDFAIGSIVTRAEWFYELREGYKHSFFILQTASGDYYVTEKDPYGVHWN